MKTITPVSITAAAVAAMLLAACASTPKPVGQLEQARSAVQALARNPRSDQVAGQQLQAAREALQSADAAHERHQPLAKVEHFAFMAERHAQIGEARIAEADAQRQVAQAQEERNRVLLQARSREAQQAQSAAQQAQARQAQASAQQQSRIQALKQQLTDLKATQTKQGMVLTLGDVLFDTGQATLKPGAAQTMDHVAQFLHSHPKMRVLVQGYTDSRGSDQYNLTLSQQRAQAVADALQARGVAPDRMQAIGRGEGYPVASNSSAAGRQQNRRVAILFSNINGRFAQGTAPQGSGGVLR